MFYVVQIGEHVECAAETPLRALRIKTPAVPPVSYTQFDAAKYQIVYLYPILRVELPPTGKTGR